jgi:hypothetical protein
MPKFRFLLLIAGVIAAAIIAGCGSSDEEPTPTVAPPTPVVQQVAPTVALPTPTSEPATPTPELATPTPVADSPLDQPAAPESPLAAPESPLAAPAADAGTAAPDWLADAGIYQDEVAGFTVQYPGSWDLLDLPLEQKESSTGYAVTINSWPRDEGGAQGIPEGGTKVDIAVQRTGVLNPEEAIAQRRQQILDEGTEILTEDVWTLDGDLLAVRRHVQGTMAEAVEVVTAINGYTVLIWGMGDFDRVDEIARSLRRSE